MGGMRGSTVIASVGTFVQAAHDAAVVPVVHAIAGGQPVAPGVAFVGRQEETEKLLAALAPGDGEPVVNAGPVVVSAVAGMGGVGKTALVRFCAAEAVERGWFPGGAYVVDLQGYSPGGMVARDALFAPLLHQFGVPAENVPGEPAAQAAVYDQALRFLASQGRRVLLVLDNASTAAQVDGLLPTAGDHRVVVTTRDTLAIPGARRLDLDVLTVADALELLDEALREHDPADERAVETEAAALVGVCGLLPLAVRIVAGLLADEPDMSCAELATELANTPADGFAHGETRLAPVLAASIDRLAAGDPQAERLLRLLQVNPGPDISTEAAAALGGLSVAAARTSLRALRQAHLITHAERRWQLHDLVRRYLLDRHADQDAAISRLLDHYTATATAADRHFRFLPGQPMPELFDGRDQAFAWLDAEHANLVAAVQLAATRHDARCTFHLALALTGYQLWRRHFNDLLTVSQVALDVCQENENRLLTGTAWDNLGVALQNVQRLEEAAIAHEHARDIFQEVEDREHEATAWDHLGLALRELRRFAEAVTAHEHSLAICQEFGDRPGEGVAWNNLALALQELEQFDKAINALEHARDIHQETGNRHGEGSAWNNLGLVLQKLGQLDTAINAHERARAIHQETGDRYREGTAWNNLGVALGSLRRFNEAIRCYQEAAAAFIESGAADSVPKLRVLFKSSRSQR